jgi:hypothetical protein
MYDLLKSCLEKHNLNFKLTYLFFHMTIIKIIYKITKNIIITLAIIIGLIIVILITYFEASSRTFLRM